MSGVVRYFQVGIVGYFLVLIGGGCCILQFMFVFKKLVSSLFVVVIGIVGFSVFVGVFVIVMIVFVFVVMGMIVINILGIFELLFEYMVIDNWYQKNEIFVKNVDGIDFWIVDVFDQNCDELLFDQMSDYLKYVVIVGEDCCFYDYGGVDVVFVVCVVIGQVINILISGVLMIMMQLVKNIWVQEVFNEIIGVDGKLIIDQQCKDDIDVVQV